MNKYHKRVIRIQANRLLKLAKDVIPLALLRDPNGELTFEKSARKYARDSQGFRYLVEELDRRVTHLNMYQAASVMRHIVRGEYPYYSRPNGNAYSIKKRMCEKLFPSKDY